MGIWNQWNSRMSVKEFSLFICTSAIMGNYAGWLGQLKPDGSTVCTDTSYLWFPWRVANPCVQNNDSVGLSCKWKCLLHIQRNRSVFHTLWLQCQWKCLIHFLMLLWNWQLNGESDRVTVLSRTCEQLHQCWSNVSKLPREEIQPFKGIEKKEILKE